MANKKLFGSSARGKTAPAADTVNAAGGLAYKASSKEALAQYVATGCLGATFYASAEEQLDEILKLAAEVSPEFVAQAAVYGRHSAFMKDAPALLLAHLATRGPSGLAALKAAFPKVIDNPKMLRNFVQILRSGRVGRKSMGTAPKTLVKAWFDARSDVQLFRATGDKPSLGDVIKMVHPKPQNAARKALYALLVGKDYDLAACDPLVQEYEAWKADPSRDIPDVPFLMLTSGKLSKAQWVDIARAASWQTVRMNLNTFLRHGVFEHAETVRFLAERLRNEESIAKARVFPYQLLIAYRNTSGVPMEIQSALQDAMEIATKNVPVIEGTVAVFPDVSGSMNSPVTGARGSATTQVACRDVAALVAATILRRNPGARVLPFKEDVVKLRINPKDSIVTIAEQIAQCGSGGTNCSAPLRVLNEEKYPADLLVYVSDNESWWMDTNVSLNSYRSGHTSSPTATMAEWEKFRVRNPRAKLACIDLAPNGSRQAPTRGDILNVGGFSDDVFVLLSEFQKGSGADHWVRKIEGTSLVPAIFHERQTEPGPSAKIDWVTL